MTGIERAACLLLLVLVLSGCAGDPRETLPPAVPVPSEGGATLLPLDCTTAQGVARLVCDDDELAALDLQLKEVFEAAGHQTPEARYSTLQAIQHGWAKGRDKCLEQGDKRTCLADIYQRRIAELQAQYRLVEQRGPVRFACGDRPANEVTVTWFDTKPETLIAERGDSESLMYRQVGEKADYRGRNESLSEHQEAITVVWGHGAPQITCQVAP